MYIKKSIIERLISDNKFRTGLSEKLGISNRSVYNSALKYVGKITPNSQFTRIVCINYFKSQGYTDNQILTEDISAV